MNFLKKTSICLCFAGSYAKNRRQKKLTVIQKSTLLLHSVMEWQKKKKEKICLSCDTTCRGERQARKVYGFTCSKGHTAALNVNIWKNRWRRRKNLTCNVLKQMVKSIGFVHRIVEIKMYVNEMRFLLVISKCQGVTRSCSVSINITTDLHCQ